MRSMKRRARTRIAVSQRGTDELKGMERRVRIQIDISKRFWTATELESLFP